jgi:hypothetical protein
MVHDLTLVANSCSVGQEISWVQTTEGSSPCLQKPTIVPCSEPLSFALKSLKWSVPMRFSNQNVLIYWVSHMCSMSFHHIFLDLITVTILYEEYKLWSSSYALFSILLLHHVSYVQMLSSALCSQSVQFDSWSEYWLSWVAYWNGLQTALPPSFASSHHSLLNSFLYLIECY